MKFLAVTAVFAGLAANALAAPAPEAQGTSFSALLTFTGGDPKAFYTVSVPADGRNVLINNPLSVSHIRSEGGATCSAFGKQGSATTLVGAQTVDVGPPQAQVSVSCRAF